MQSRDLVHNSYTIPEALMRYSTKYCQLDLLIIIKAPIIIHLYYYFQNFLKLLSVCFDILKQNFF